MVGSGIHYAVTREQMGRLRVAAREGDAAVLDALYEIEPTLAEGDSQITDKAWELIHRALTGDCTPGERLDPNSGSAPLNRCVLGGRHLKPGGNTMACLAEPDEVAALASALARFDEASLRRRLLALDRPPWTRNVEDDFGYLWCWFKHLRRFLTRAGGLERAVVFKADRCAFVRAPRRGAP